MRKIKFRGQDVETKEWQYGYLVVDSITGKRASLIEFADFGEDDKNGGAYVWNDVIPETVGQSTGFKDGWLQDIYEGDVLLCHEYDPNEHRIAQTFENAVVGFENGSFYYYPKGNMRQPHQLLMYAYKPEIIGNIHSNPELLKP